MLCPLTENCIIRTKKVSKKSYKHEQQVSHVFVYILTKTLVNLLSNSFGSGIGCLDRILACLTWCCVLIVSGNVVIGDSLRVELALPIIITQ